MRKSLHQGTKADVAKRKFSKELIPAGKPGTGQFKVVTDFSEARIVTFNHPCLLQ
jgi:hypothetical protein|nr:MAG TPA: hypothetical protein [Caudoviricetes sp.]